MLCAGAQPADQKRGYQQRKALAQAGKNIADAGQRSAERQHQSRTVTFGEITRGRSESLQACRRKPTSSRRARHNRARIHSARSARIIIDEIGITIVQRMRATGNADRAAFLTFALRDRRRCQRWRSWLLGATFNESGASNT